MSTDYGRHPIRYKDSTCIFCGLPIVVRREAARTTHLCPTHTRDAMYAKGLAGRAKAKVKREAGAENAELTPSLDRGHRRTPASAETPSEPESS